MAPIVPKRKSSPRRAKEKAAATLGTPGPARRDGSGGARAETGGSASVSPDNAEANDDVLHASMRSSGHANGIAGSGARRTGKAHRSPPVSSTRVLTGAPAVGGGGIITSRASSAHAQHGAEHSSRDNRSPSTRFMQQMQYSPRAKDYSVHTAPKSMHEKRRPSGAGPSSSYKAWVRCCVHMVTCSFSGGSCSSASHAAGGMSYLPWILITSLSLLFLSVTLLERASHLPGYNSGALLQTNSVWRGQAGLGSAREALQISAKEQMRIRRRCSEEQLELIAAAAAKAAAGGAAAGAWHGQEAQGTSLGERRSLEEEANGDMGVASAIGAQSGNTARLRHLTGEAAESTKLHELQGFPEVTIFTTPQPYTSDAADPQLLALRSWLALPPSVRVVLVGRDDSLERVARMVPGDRVSVDKEVDCDMFGVPLLNSLLDAMQRHQAAQVEHHRKGGPHGMQRDACGGASERKSTMLQIEDTEDASAVSESSQASPCSEASTTGASVPPASVWVSPDVVLTADLLAAIRKLSLRSERWAAVAATRHVAEGSLPFRLLPPLPAAPASGGEKEEGGGGDGEKGSHSSSSAPDEEGQVLAQFLEVQRKLRAHGRASGVLDPRGRVDFFAWGGGSWEGGLIPGHARVPPFSSRHDNITRWLAGVLTEGSETVESLVEGDGKRGKGAAADGAQRKGGGAAEEQALVVDVSDVLSVLRPSHQEWDRENIPRGRPWPSLAGDGHAGRKRKSRQLAAWQTLRNEHMLAAEATAIHSRSLNNASAGADMSLRSGQPWRPITEAGGLPLSSQQQLEQRWEGLGAHWTERMQGGPQLAGWELVSCHEAAAGHMCLKRRLRPARCRCMHSPFAAASRADVYPSGAGKQWLCGPNTFKWDPPHPKEVMDPALQAQAQVDRALRRKLRGSHVLKAPIIAMEDLLPFVAVKQPDGAKLVLMVGVTGQYNPMLLNFVCNLRRLGLTSALVVAAMDSDAYSFAMSHGLPVYYEGLTLKQVLGEAKKGKKGADLAALGCEYGTDCFKRLTKVKSRAVLRVLKAGYTVLWTDVDIVWFANPIPELIKFGPGVLPIQTNEPLTRRPSRINSGFYLARPDRLTIEAFEDIVVHAAKSNRSEQPSFDQVLCGERGPYKVHGKPECKHPNGLRTVFLDRRRFPNGAIFDYWNTPNVNSTCTRMNCTILHNNWIAGKEGKEDRFVKKGFWFYDLQRQVCARKAIKTASRTTLYD